MLGAVFKAVPLIVNRRVEAKPNTALQGTLRDRAAPAQFGVSIIEIYTLRVIRTERGR